MRFLGEFETLKMVEQGNKVHCGVECTEGQLLIYLIRRGTMIEKEQLCIWLQELCTQLDAYHRCRHRAYQYISPYAIIISEDNKVKLLDLESKENESVLIYMQKNVIREAFGKHKGIRKTKIPTDYYSLGKTMQFVIANGKINPEINMIESHIFYRIIQKCLEESTKNQFQSIEEIQNQIPKIKKKSKSGQKIP